MRLSQAALLGLVQGVSEFLPVSSTAHLIALPRLLGWERPGLSFDTSLHLGTLLAAVLVLRKDLMNTVVSLKDLPGSELSSGWQILLGTLPAGLAGLLLEKPMETHLRSSVYLSAGMALGAGLLALADTPVSPRVRCAHPLLTMAAAQTLALFPGVSRSGVTLATGLACGLSRTAAARASFLVGLPIISAAGLFKLKDLITTPLSRHEQAILATALVTATLSGWLSLKVLLGVLERHSLRPLVWYRLGLAILLLAQAQNCASD